MSYLNKIQTRNTLNSLKKDLEKHLENVIDYDFSNIKSGITNILENYSNVDALYDYMVVCDNTNNTPYTKSKNFAIVDVYIKPNESSDFIINNITILPNENRIRIEKLRKERKEKLNKIIEKYDGY